MDLVGKKIYELEILERIRKKGRTYYGVKCSCGKEFETRRDSITSGRTKSCGHLTQFKGENLIGQTFGRLTVVKKLGINKEGRQLWECECICGNTTTVDTSLLRKGKTKSCGCIANETLEKNQEIMQEKITDRHRKENTYIPGLSMKTPSHNTSGVKGVHWSTSRNRWVAQIQFQGKNHTLGRFEKKEDAIAARKEAEEKYFRPVIERHKE